MKELSCHEQFQTETFWVNQFKLHNQQDQLDQEVRQIILHLLTVRALCMVTIHETWMNSQTAMAIQGVWVNYKNYTQIILMNLGIFMENTI